MTQNLRAAGRVWRTSRKRKWSKWLLAVTIANENSEWKEVIKRHLHSSGYNWNFTNVWIPLIWRSTMMPSSYKTLKKIRDVWHLQNIGGIWVMGSFLYFFCLLWWWCTICKWYWVVQRIKLKVRKLRPMGQMWSTNLFLLRQRHAHLFTYCLWQLLCHSSRAQVVVTKTMGMAH